MDIKNLPFSKKHKITKSGLVYGIRFKRPLTTFKDRDGYVRVNLFVDSKLRQCLVHRLIAQTFIKNPKNLPIVNHKNEKRDDNRIENLEWVTIKDNMKQRWYKNYKCKKCGIENFRIGDINPLRKRVYNRLEGMKLKDLADKVEEIVKKLNE